MANVVRDPRQHPDAIIPDMSKPDPYDVYEGRCRLRLRQPMEATLYLSGRRIFPIASSMGHHARALAALSCAEERRLVGCSIPTTICSVRRARSCDGCHSVNYDIKTKSVTEWNVGCEACHGAGSAHVADPVRITIINPARLDYVAANDTCIRCHSQGRPNTNPIDGKYYDWPVGFTWECDWPTIGTSSRTRRGIDLHPFC